MICFSPKWGYKPTWIVTRFMMAFLLHVCTPFFWANVFHKVQHGSTSPMKRDLKRGLARCDKTGPVCTRAKGLVAKSCQKPAKTLCLCVMCGKLTDFEHELRELWEAPAAKVAKTHRAGLKPLGPWPQVVPSIGTAEGSRGAFHQGAVEPREFQSNW